MENVAIENGKFKMGNNIIIKYFKSQKYEIVMLYRKMKI